jgi:hypothetical protein
MKSTLGLIGVVGCAATLAAPSAPLKVQAPRAITLAGEPNHAIVAADGTIIVSGQFQGNEGDPFSNLLVLAPDGRVLKRLPAILYPQVPWEWGSYGSQVGLAAALEDGGFIVLAGLESQPFHLNADGTPDESFNGRYGANAPVFQVIIQSDGKLLFAGAFDGIPLRRTFEDRRTARLILFHPTMP